MALEGLSLTHRILQGACQEDQVQLDIHSEHDRARAQQRKDRGDQQQNQARDPEGLRLQEHRFHDRHDLPCLL